MRLRTMELPMTEDEHGKMQTPYLLVFDRCESSDISDLQAMSEQGLRETSGARAVLLFTGNVEIAGQYDA